MSTEEKLNRRIENYRSGDSISFADLKKYLILHGFTCNKKTGSSHMMFRHEKLQRPFPVPVHSNKVKVAYIKKACELVEDIQKEKER